MLAQHGIDTPRGRLVTPDELPAHEAIRARWGWRFPVIVKPNYEGSSKGIGDDAVVRDAQALAEVLPQALRAYPDGVLVEEFIAGTDVTVPFLEGRGDDGVLLPVDYVVDPAARSRFNLYDYRLKSAEASKVSVRCPPDLPRDVVSRLRAISKHGGARARHPRSRAHRLPRSARTGASTCWRSTRCPRWSPAPASSPPPRARAWTTTRRCTPSSQSAARRQGLVVQAGRAPPPARRAAAHRLHLQRQARRLEGAATTPRPSTTRPRPSTRSARRSRATATGDAVRGDGRAAARSSMQTPVDLVFNIAEGVAGRNREAAVPALCELMGIPYTGSDAATLSIALDKALSKRVLLQHGILTAEFQVMETGRERLSPKLKFPLIVKPNQEGSSKGVSASASVVDDEEALRAVVRELIDRYRQPALIEDYIPGREFTVGLLGDRRPRVLPPMEIVFKDKSEHAARLRLPDQAGVGEARLATSARPAVAGRAEGDRARLPRDLRGARLPRRRARRPAHDARRARSTSSR